MAADINADVNGCVLVWRDAEKNQSCYEREERGLQSGTVTCRTSRAGEQRLVQRLEEGAHLQKQQG